MFDPTSNLIRMLVDSAASLRWSDPEDPTDELAARLSDFCQDDGPLQDWCEDEGADFWEVVGIARDVIIGWN